MPVEPIAPCWDPSNVRRAISSAGIALLSADTRPYFLATHAPVTRIWEDRARRTIGEAEFFRQIMTAGGEVMAVVHGNPGTGKSHLIHWLKLRTDDALAEGELSNLRTVLIQRSTGTLKDALTQMLQQLGGGFERHLEPVRQALEKISDHSAREKLLSELSLELGSRRHDRDKKPLPRSLMGLVEACSSEGVGRRWLCRAGGAIDLNIRRLTEPAGAEGPAEMAEFTPADLDPPVEYRHSRHVSEAVRDLLDELDDDEDLRAEAVAEMNDAIRHAIQEVTGLGGNRLRQVFDDVRRELKEQGQSLALFVEDVSAVGELDAEVINAVEPQQRPDLCRMIAVLGITQAGFEKLRENISQRLTHVYTVGSVDADSWRDNPDETAKFAARYLNAIRLEEPAVRRLAEQRRTHGDITESKCTACAQVDRCHRVFGKVTINGVDVGLFPFTTMAPHRLLNNLATDRPGIQKTPRGLLAHAMVPVLSDGGGHVGLSLLPPITLPVNFQSFDHWTVFVQQYGSGAGWTEEQRQRLRVLAGLWFELPSRAEPGQIASALQPVLEHLEFPDFSKGVAKRDGQETGAEQEKEKEKEKERPKRQRDAKADGKFTNFKSRLDRWKSGEKFQQDQEPRKLLAGLIRRGVAWDEERVPVGVWKTLMGDGEKYEHVRIEGQTSMPTTAFTLDFPRNDATYHVLEALAHFAYTGDNSWEFDYGPTYQRHVSRWLRDNEPRIIQQLKAAGELDSSLPAATAVRFLAAVAMLRRRGKLPEKRDDLVREILADIWGDADKPVVLSGPLQALVDDMEMRHREIRAFLLAELNVPQGVTGGLNFVDPLPILRHAESFTTDLQAGPLQDGYFTSYWKSRFAAMQRMSGYANFRAALATERLALAQALEQVRVLLENAGLDPTDAATAVPAYCRALGEVMTAKRETKLVPQPDEAFDPLWRRRSYTDSADAWGRAVQRGWELATADGNELDVLLFDPTKVKEAEHHLRTADNYVRDLKGNLDEIEKGLFADEGEADMEAELLQLVAAISETDGTPVLQSAGGTQSDQGSDRHEATDDNGDSQIK